MKFSHIQTLKTYNPLMIRIDNVRFDFIAPEEKFVRHLYANWDEFCHSCFEQVVEECCIPYDDEETLYQLDMIDIDLGNIQEEKLYEEYPNRLRQELKRILMSKLNGMMANDRAGSTSRVRNIIYRLKYGFFNMKGDHYHSYDDNVKKSHHKSLMNSEVHDIASLVISDGNALRRLLIHVEDSALLLRVFAACITMQEFTVWQKNQFLMTFLELKGDIPVRFIHESDGKNDLYMLAELLDSRSVRRIMQIEMERHSKAGMPVYWHYLYEWLLQYYPYNDASLFGGKSQFVRHLHQRFLTFIYNHTYLSYLSEYELTLEFLSEVFGHDQYLRVAEAINKLLRRNVGNMAHETCLSREMYMAFLRLSMLRHTFQENKHDFEGTHVSSVMTCDVGNPDILIAFLSDSSVARSDKTTLIMRIVKERPNLFVEWLQMNFPGKDILISYLVDVADEDFLNRLLASISLSLLDVMIDIKRTIIDRKDDIIWLNDISNMKFEIAWNKSVLLCIASGDTDSEHLRVASSKNDLVSNIRLLLLNLCNEIKGIADEPEIDNLINDIYYSAKPMESDPDEEKQTNYYVRLLRKALILHDSDQCNERTVVSLFWDHYSDSFPEAVNILHHEAMLTTVIKHTNSIVLNEIYRKLAKRAYSGEALSVVLLISEWMEMHKEYVRSYINSSVNDVSVLMILWLQFHNKPASGTSSREIAFALLEFLVGESNTERVYNEIMECCIKDVDNAAEELLFAEELKDCHESNLSYLIGKTSISTDILAGANLQEHQRYRLLEYFMNSCPTDLLEYIRKSIKQDIIPVNVWCKWVVAEDWRRLAYTISVSIADLFVQIIEMLNIDSQKECLLWATYLSEHQDEDMKYNTSEDNMKVFIATFAKIDGMDNNEIDNVISSVKKSLGIEKEENTLMEDFDGKYQIPNAGLCLLAPWFVRLFDMLGYLDSEHKAFKDTSSKIRAVFLLQYLVYGEERQCKENDLFFNRVLTDIPVSIPLPKSLSLSEIEKETADGMIAGVKANWQKMDGTSINGFRKSFISRNGVMSRPNDHWVITVEEKAYDILLDTVPWGFRQIRLPWLKKIIQVVWQDKQLI